MKRGFVLLVCLISLMLCAFAETDEPYYENADILARCPLLCTFEDVPSPLLAGEALAVYRQLHPDTELDDSSIYALIFASGEYTPSEETLLINADMPIVRVCTDSVTEQPDGSLTVSVHTECDYGAGFEFGILADIKLNSADGRVLSVFIPE